VFTSVPHIVTTWAQVPPESCWHYCEPIATANILYNVVFFTAQNGISPLYVASQEGQTEVVDSLLKNGADPNHTTTVWNIAA